MTKMATTPIYGKTLLNSFHQNQKVDDFGTRYVALGMWGLPNLFKWWTKVELDQLNVKVKFAS